MMLAYARSLRTAVRADGEGCLSTRSVKNVADSVKAVLTDAVEEGLIAANPCAWNARKHLPAVVDADPSRRHGGFCEPDEVRALVTSPLVPPVRRVAYALAFLTGMRPGEVAALRRKDVDLAFPPGGRIVVAHAWSSDYAVEGPTKTKVTKLVPIHPALRHILERWIAQGFARVFGRPCSPSDLLVPAPRGGHRMASQANREFQQDLARLGLRKRVHSDARATFRSLALAARPDLERFVDLVTHPSPKEAKDLYRRVQPLWPRMCEAVAAIELGPSRRLRGGALHRDRARDAVRGVLRALQMGRLDLAVRDLRRLEQDLGRTTSGTAR